jgi:anti-sigma regulatory factor (Ser/Thr protein kinase)
MSSDKVVTTDLGRGANAPRTARRVVLAAIGNIGSIQFVRNAVLLTSEVVTNAVEHTVGSCVVTIRLDRVRLRVEVGDQSSVDPERAPRDTRTGGRGLYLLDDLADRWGTTPSSSGKTVWFEILID